MARTVTRADLRTRIRRRADIENATARFPDAELNDEINESIARLYRLLVSARGADYYETTTNVTTVAGTAAYALPATFLELISVETTIDGNRCKLDRYMPNERPWLRDTANWSYFDGPPMYRLRGDFIDFAPIPTAVYTVALYYVPAPSALTADSGAGGTFDGIAGFEEYVVLDVAIKCRMKNAKDYQSLVADRQVILDEIQRLAPQRDNNSPERVTDKSMSFEWWT